MKTSPNNEKPYKESNEKKYHWYEGHGEHDLIWVIHKPEDCSGPKKKQKEYKDRKKKSNNYSNNGNQ